MEGSWAMKPNKPKSWRKPMRILGQSTVKPTPYSTNIFSLLEMSTGSSKDMLTPQSPVAELKTKKAIPQEFSSQPPDPSLVLVCSTTLWRGLELPLQIHTI